MQLLEPQSPHPLHPPQFVAAKSLINNPPIKTFTIQNKITHCEYICLCTSFSAAVMGPTHDHDSTVLYVKSYFSVAFPYSTNTNPAK